MNWLSILLKYFPVVLQGAIAVESAVGAAPGSSKKAIVLNAITAGAQVGEAVPESHVAGISRLIDIVVGDLNSNGMAGFGKKALPAPVDTAAFSRP